jgi:hypothetical protein
MTEAFLDPARTVRAFKIHLTAGGKRVGHVPFERDGANRAVFEWHTDTQALNHAISAALKAGLGQCRERIDDYKIDVTYMDPVYDPDRDLYVDPVTGVEDSGCRAKRLVEESSPTAFWGD